ncbi:MAG: hypothetical protein PHE27_03015, partial [Alphaproteobacteria bacterium]|nr:hypothetical protein [Alphaproteobacteria bacterium]
GFALGRDVLLTPYVDLGFRFWDRDFSAQPTEHFQTFEILGGAMVQYSPIDRLVLTAYGELGTIFAPQRKVSDVTYDFGEGGAYKVGGRIGYRVTDRVEVFTSLDVSHFRMVKSSSLSGLYAPSGNNTDTSIRAGVSYHLK